MKLDQKTQKCKQLNAAKIKHKTEETLNPYLQLLSESSLDKPKKFHQILRLAYFKDILANFSSISSSGKGPWHPFTEKFRL